jgi:flavin-dependent dehydrogenase
MVMLQLPQTEQSLWRDSYSGSRYAPLSGEVEVDVAIIGAGITGLTTAYLLKQAGRTVAVLDKATVGGGTSGRTTGKVTSQRLKRSVKLSAPSISTVAGGMRTTMSLPTRTTSLKRCSRKPELLPNWACLPVS